MNAILNVVNETTFTADDQRGPYNTECNTRAARIFRFQDKN